MDKEAVLEEDADLKVLIEDYDNQVKNHPERMEEYQRLWMHESRIS